MMINIYIMRLKTIIILLNKILHEEKMLIEKRSCNKEKKVIKIDRFLMRIVPLKFR